MKNISAKIEWIEAHPVVGKAILVCVISMVGILGSLFIQSMNKEVINPVFYSLSNSYRIVAVHQYEKSNDVAGYKHLGQNSRPDQWNKLIEIKSNLFGLRHRIKPKNKEYILTVIISLRGKDRSILFNK